MRLPFRRDRSGAFAMTGSLPAKRATENDPTSTLQAWQKQAWGYYEVLGEAHYAGGFLARMLSGIRLEVQQRQPSGDWKETANATMREPLEDLENSKGGLSELQASYGLLRFVQGEAMLTRTLEGFGSDALGIPLVVNGETYSECWEMLSAAELSYKKSSGARGEYLRKRKPGSTPETFPETDPDDPQPGTMTAWRFYHRDPQYSGLADSSMRAVLEDLEELLLLKRAIRNTARNRGAGNGILILPTSLQGEMLDSGDGKQVPSNAKTIYEALTSPIANENASHAVTPILLFGNEVTSQNAFHIDLRGAALYKETGLRDECIRRIGIGLDMPPEALLGTSGLNHWSAWQIDESAWKSHGAPIAEEFVGQLTSALITPKAIESGLDPDDFRVWYDASEVVQDPDRGRTAMEGHDRLIISDAAARRDLGYDEADAPTPEEWDKRAAIAKPVNSPTTNPAKSEPSKGEASAERVIGLAQACVQRCRALAGSRLRSQILQKDSCPPNLRARCKGVPNWDIARTLGMDVRDQCDPDSLVAGAGDEFLGQMVTLGLEPSIAESVVRRTEEHAARTLFDAGDTDLPDEVIALCAVTSLRV